MLDDWFRYDLLYFLVPLDILNLQNVVADFYERVSGDFGCHTEGSKYITLHKDRTYASGVITDSLVL